MLLNACTDRWTMVHEMLHHNFNVQRKKYRPLDSDEVVIASLMHELNQMQETVDAYNSSPTEYTGMALVHSLDRVRDLLIRFTYQTSFEEVSIESLLMREYALARLSNVPYTAAKNALNYIRYSTASGVERLDPIKGAALDLESSAKAYGWERVRRNANTLVAKIDTFEDDSSCYEDEAVSVYKQASLAGVFPVEVQWSATTDDSRLRHEIEAHSTKPEFKKIEAELKKTLGQLTR